jgi:ubiquinone/menaquinone biosynthesis C-methylase UbiE
MSDQTYRFNDGAAYEQMMGAWSRLVGEIFLDWLAPIPGLDWIDIGCGNGVITEAILQRCDAESLQAIDPSEGQLAYARARPGTQGAHFHQGDAMALPFADGSADIAIMALVLFFVPDPARGVAEMVRVVRPGGTVAAYLWDFATGGFPFEPIMAELRALGFTPPLPPSVGVSRMEVLQAQWQTAGLADIETKVITVERSFPDFETFWQATTQASMLKSLVDQMSEPDLAAFKQRVAARLSGAADGSVTYRSHANAIKGVVPRV